MPVSAVIEIDGLCVCPRCAYPVVRHELFLAEGTVDEPVPINPDRITAADGLTDHTKILENRVDGGASHVEVDAEIDRGSFGLPNQFDLIQRGLYVGRDFRFCRAGIFQAL